MDLVIYSISCALSGIQDAGTDQRILVLLITYILRIIDNWSLKIYSDFLKKSKKKKVYLKKEADFSRVF